MTGIAYLLLAIGALVVLLAGVAGFLWVVQVLLNAHQSGEKSS